MKTVSLVLGSGGARGYAHIGVIEVLLLKDYEIKSISGTSMGALIGGLYACGKLEEFKQWVLTIDPLEIIKLLDLSFSKTGLIKGEKILEKIEELIGEVKIEDLDISFTAVASDIVKQKEVWIQEGKLIDAIRASIAIPTMFTPKKINGNYLVDGGILNPLPIAPTIADNTDLTIAVGLYSDSKKQYNIKIKKPKKKKIFNINKRFLDFFKKEEEEKDSLDIDPENMGMYSIVWHTIDTMQNTIMKYKLAGHTPDIEINISKYACEFYEFNEAEKMIEVGKIEAKEVLE
ncbi:patatin [Halarcobacter mediterraneus]|uniref:Patatin n=1 Tax=Halarcobacter mediterraneus TaxID=2023153 RepID=A0A4Q1AU45_9BACT|nr:patatin-like phospholipase family protein [Halarcobacter mediterraneus]RXK13303.1 patatin [Halarcobacter mediterraneus]